MDRPVKPIRHPHRSILRIPVNTMHMEQEPSHQEEAELRRMAVGPNHLWGGTDSRLLHPQCLHCQQDQ